MRNIEVNLLTDIRRFLLFFGLCFFVTGCGFFEPGLYKVCEDTLQKRLQSPSGYKRAGINSYVEKMTVADYEEKILSPLTDKERENFNNGKAVPTRHILFIEYDAPNIYGTPIRELAKCEYFSQYGNADSASVHNVRINDQTNSEWLLSQVERF